jgi:hypothetical protein
MMSGEARGSRAGEDSARLFTGVVASGQARAGPFCSTRGLPLMPPNFQEKKISYNRVNLKLSCQMLCCGSVTFCITEQE